MGSAVCMSTRPIHAVHSLHCHYSAVSSVLLPDASLHCRYTPGSGGHGQHNHGGCLCSGVFYVSLPSGAPPLEFVDPRDARARVETHDSDNFPPVIKDGHDDAWDLAALDIPFRHGDDARGPFSTRRIFKAARGDMVLFPPWLIHQVPDEWTTLPTIEAGTRIVYSFNLLATPESDDEARGDESSSER